MSMATRQALRDSSNLDSPYAKALLSRPKPQRSSRQPRRQICEPPVKPTTEEDEEAYFSVDECPSTPAAAAAAPEKLYDNLEPSAAPVVSVNQQLLSELSGVLGARRSAKPTESPARRSTRSSTAPGAQASVLANAAAEMVAQRAKKKEAAAEKARAAEAEATKAAEAEAARVAEAEAEHARAMAEVEAESEKARLEAEAKMRELEEAQAAAEAKAEALKAAAAQHVAEAEAVKKAKAAEETRLAALAAEVKAAEARQAAKAEAKVAAEAKAAEEAEAAAAQQAAEAKAAEEARVAEAPSPSLSPPGLVSRDEQAVAEDSAVDSAMVAVVVAEEEAAPEEEVEAVMKEAAEEEAEAKAEEEAEGKAEEEPVEEAEEEPTSWLRGGLEGSSAPGLSAVLAWLASSSTSAAAAAEEGGGGWRGAEAVPETPPRAGAAAGFDFSELKRISFLRTPPSAHGTRVSRVFQKPSHQQALLHTWLTSVDEAPTSVPATSAGLEAVSESPPAAHDAAGSTLARGSSLPLKPPPARRTAARAPPSNASRAVASKPALGSRIGVPAPSKRVPLAGVPRPASARAEISSSRAAIQGSSRAVVRPRTSGGGKLSSSASASSLPVPKSRR